MALTTGIVTSLAASGRHVENHGAASPIFEGLPVDASGAR
jgi:hypothetical protein